MVFVVAIFMTIAGSTFTYVAVGIARTQERKRGYLECEQRLDLLRKQIRRLRTR